MHCNGESQSSKARYTLATKSNSTRSTLLKVDEIDRVALAPYALATKSKGGSTFGRQSRPSWRQCRPRQAVEFKLLPICWQNRQQSRPYTATVDFVADLLPVSATVDFQQSQPCWTRLCRHCVSGLKQQISLCRYSTYHCHVWLSLVLRQCD